MILLYYGVPLMLIISAVKLSQKKNAMVGWGYVIVHLVCISLIAIFMRSAMSVDATGLLNSILSLTVSAVVAAKYSD